MLESGVASEFPIPPSVLTLVRAYRRLLEQRFGERLQFVRLFGSFARGDAETDSDVDVAVVVTDLTEGERTVAIDLAYAAWSRSPTTGPLSPLVWSQAELEDRVRSERRIAHDILSGGIAL